MLVGILVTSLKNLKTFLFSLLTSKLDLTLTVLAGVQIWPSLQVRLFFPQIPSYATLLSQ